MSEEHQKNISTAISYCEDGLADRFGAFIIRVLEQSKTRKAAVGHDNGVEVLPWQIIDMKALIDGYEWSSDDLRELVLADAMDAFKEKAHENWVADQRRIREAEAKKIEGKAKIDREIEKLARLLCTQDGNDPDGGPKRGFGWINYQSNAKQVLKSLGMIDE